MRACRAVSARRGERGGEELVVSRWEVAHSSPGSEEREECERESGDEAREVSTASEAGRVEGAVEGRLCRFGGGVVARPTEEADRAGEEYSSRCDRTPPGKRVGGV